MILVRRIVPIALALTLGWPAVSAHAATCSDYSNQAEAQRAADTRDADGDGIYCESLPCPCSTGAGTTQPRPKPTPSKPAFECGKERWTVKTTNDKRAGLIDLDPQATSVDTLRGLPPPGVGRHTPRIMGTETTVFRVRAQLVAMKFEDDGDIHLVITSRTNRKHTMIVEFPNRGCIAKVGPTKRNKMIRARNALTKACGSAGASHFTTLHGTVTIDGVGFYDVIHGQRGVAPNGIELHPVLRFANASCRSS